MSAIDCIITAAGLSSRMGQWKMMLPWEQGTILDTSIKNALQFCSRIILVTGYRGNELHERYANQSNITIIHNPDYAQGLLTSVKAAVPAVQTEHCFLTHGDMPTLTIDIFRKIWSLRNDGAILPLHNGIPCSSDFSVKTMLDTGNPTTQCHQYASGTPYGRSLFRRNRKCRNNFRY